MSEPDDSAEIPDAEILEFWHSLAVTMKETLGGAWNAAAKSWRLETLVGSVAVRFVYRGPASSYWVECEFDDPARSLPATRYIPKTRLLRIELDRNVSHAARLAVRALLFAIYYPERMSYG